MRFHITIEPGLRSLFRGNQRWNYYIKVYDGGSHIADLENHASGFKTPEKAQEKARERVKNYCDTKHAWIKRQKWIKENTITLEVDCCE
jgi:hypothetical protein